jgi:hypothetical protein
MTLVIIGHVLCATAWWFAHEQRTVTGQIRWINLAVVGVVTVAFADATWLLRARWLLRMRRRQLLADWTHTAPPSIDTSLVVAGPGLDRFHRPSCALAAGRGWSSVDRSVVEDRLPCGVCRP